MLMGLVSTLILVFIPKRLNKRLFLIPAAFSFSGAHYLISLGPAIPHNPKWLAAGLILAEISRAVPIAFSYPFLLDILSSNLPKTYYDGVSSMVSSVRSGVMYSGLMAGSILGPLF